jgi:nucleoid-associated protein EbfC
MHLNNTIMFGDIMGMMGKLKETQQKIEDTKKRLDTVLLDEKSSDGMLAITVTANRQIKSITIDDRLLTDKEQLEDYLILVLNKVIAKATSVNEAELAAVAKDGMPNIPGMDGLFK